ncbi:MAG: hypothetical protein OIF47_07475 [Marinibacterium sp.]|nr:hypothetical protein [Marinibacterium sp.]
MTETNRDDSGAILLSFTGIGHQVGVINVQHPEFFGAGRSFDNTLFVSDKTRSWGNRLDFNRLAEVVAPYAAGRDVYSIGNSMGAFLAILGSSFVPMKTVLSFAPQYSIDPAVVPWETRWTEFTGTLDRIVYSKAGDYMVDGTQYYVFSGGRGDDLKHAQLFPVRDNLFHVLFPNAGHGLSAQLKKKKMLKPIIHGCFGGKTDFRMPPKRRVLSPASAGTVAA